MMRVRVQVIASLLLATLLLSSCDSSNEWNSPVAQALEVVAAATTTPQAATPRSAPTAVVTATAIPTDSTIIVPTALPASYWQKFPKDENDRVIGGMASPVLNYSANLVTGKPCPRVTKWSYKLMADAPVPPLQPVAAPSNRCVVQNAIDDYVRTLFASASNNSPKDAESLIALYETNTALIKGIDAEQRQARKAGIKKGTAVYRVCDKQTYLLIDHTHQSPLISNNDGSVAAQIVEIRMMRIAENLQPYRCELREYSNDAVFSSATISAKSMQAGDTLSAVAYYRIWLRYNAKTQSWQDFTNSKPMNSKTFLAVAKKLLAESPVKP